MAKRSPAVDTLVADVTSAVRQELLEELRPILRKLNEATSELETALGGEGARAPRKKSPGRPPKRGPGRPAKKAGARRGAQRTPRGALQDAVAKALRSSGKPMKLSEIRDEVMNQPMFRDRDPKTLYTMIVFAVKKMDNVRKTASGEYSIKNGEGGGGAAGRKATRKA